MKDAEADGPERPAGPGAGAYETRFDEDEVRRIFELATREGEEQARGEAGGLTLTQLQSIGRDVGLAEDAVARAAALVRAGGSVAPRRTSMGVITGVGRTVPLPGPLSDRSWELLVVDLREMFAARGHAESHGSLRQWTNGNLQILLEPTDAGYQIRMRTRSANIESLLGGAWASAGSGVLIVLLGGLLAKPGAGALAVLGGLLMVMGVLLGAFAGVRGSAWADTREDQFKRVAARAAELAEREPDSRAE